MSGSPSKQEITGIPTARLCVFRDPRKQLFANLHRHKIPGLNAIRGVAALIVVAHHKITWRAPGGMAVHMFFVLSGLLITWTLLSEHQRTGSIDLRAFYVRRALRLFPAMAALLLWELLLKWPPISIRSIECAALYISNYYVAIRGSDVLLSLGQTWSLSVEEHFYLAWPLLFRLIPARGRLMWIAISGAAASVMLRVLLTYSVSPKYANYSTESNAFAILTGCALALWIWRDHDRLPRFLFSRPLAAISFVAVLGYPYLPASLSVPCAPLWVFPLAVLLLQAITYEWRILENPVLDFLGRISYSIYLWHIVAAALALRLGLPSWTQVFSIFGMAIAIAAASYYGIERPVQRWGRRKLLTPTLA
jgi:peptidoglycan/LPS O-acetylase OafA/YrhL